VKNFACRVCIMTFCALLIACGNPNQRLDEHVFYDGPQFRLKVVRYYRNIPFNQLGEHAVVMCQSENTREFPAHEQQDAGWRMLGARDAQGSKDATEAALRVKDDYEVLDDYTLTGKMNVFNISFDACGHFINWDPGRLPQAMINPVEKPDSCAPNGPADCRYYDFEGDRAPRYEQIRAAGKGQVSFTASSATFKGVELLRVHTRNNGAVWHVATVGLDKVNCRQARQGESPPGERGYPGGERVLGCADQQSLKPDTVRSLSMSLLEYGMDDISLMDWLESALPPGSMVIWPEALSACGEAQEDDGQAPSTPCAEIRFNDIKGNSGALYIAMNTDQENRPGEVSFHSGVYLSGDRSRPIESLTSLPERLSADNMY